MPHSQGGGLPTRPAGAAGSGGRTPSNREGQPHCPQDVTHPLVSAVHFLGGLGPNLQATLAQSLLPMEVNAGGCAAGLAPPHLWLHAQRTWRRHGMRSGCQGG